MVQPLKIAVITCYRQPDYIRARTLRQAVATLPDVQPIIVKNNHTGLLRYPEIVLRLLALRLRQRPDIYLLTFRGQEILPLVLLLAGRRPVWFDEFIVPLAYATSEPHRKSLGIRLKYGLARSSAPLYRHWLKRCAVILTDTPADAELSAQLAGLDRGRYLPLPVGADETLFKPALSAPRSDTFQVFYYSSGMQPLHGLPVVLAAAEALQTQPAIRFVIAGGGRPLQQAVEKAQARGAQIDYRPWVPFDQLVTTIHQSALCLGGPFGNTPQAQRVITGKTYQFLAAQAPVVVGRNSSTAEHFVDKDNALAVPLGDAEALRSAISWAYDHQAELPAIARRGRRLYEQAFSVRIIADKLAAKLRRA